MPLLLCLFLSTPAEAAPGLRAPAGFTVSEYADGKLAPDIHCLTINPSGDVVVSGRGYIRLLVEGADGKAGRALDFADAPKDGAQGLFWDKDDLYCVGDGGLRVYRDASGEGRTKPSKLLFKCKTGGEHTAHAIGRGPDGWLYLLTGDGAGISAKDVTRPTSPIKDPVGGCVLRFAPDFAGCEIVADGFRNPYGMDWNEAGDLFAFDSDNERCVSLPWYEPTRLYHVQPGGHYGWLAPKFTSFWRLPPCDFDVVAPVATLGRGSPTGVASYRHSQFPPKYRGGLFLLDWTFGKVYYVDPARKGSSYEGKPEVFIEGVGDNGFAPTAVAVHPTTGDLVVAIGGRGTRGAVYRIRHTQGYRNRHPDDKLRPLKPRPIDPVALDGAALARDAGGDKSDPYRRRIALEQILRHRDKLPIETVEAALVGATGVADSGVRRAAAQLLAALEPADRKRIAARLTMGIPATVALLAEPSLDATVLLNDEVTRLDGVRLLQIALGGIGSTAAKGTVHEGYSRRVKSPATSAALTNALLAVMAKSSGDVHREAARTLAMIEADGPAPVAAILAAVSAKTSPIDDIHYLIVLSRCVGKRDAKATAQTAAALLSLDVKIMTMNFNRDRNWPLRIAEMHAALAKRDPKLNAALLASRDFGRPDHIIFCREPSFDRKAAARRFLAHADEPGFAWNAELVALIATAEPKAALPRLRKLYGEAGLDEAILPHLAKQPTEADRGRFVEALGSAHSAIVAASLGAGEAKDARWLPTPRRGVRPGARGPPPRHRQGKQRTPPSLAHSPRQSNG